jgi:hypothetical protein
LAEAVSFQAAHHLDPLQEEVPQIHHPPVPEAGVDPLVVPKAESSKSKHFPFCGPLIALSGMISLQSDF